MRRTLPAFCISVLALCCICAHAQEKSDGDTNRPVSGEIVQSMVYKAHHQETGNMWDVWLYHHEGTYFLYYLANVGEHRWRWDNISMATSLDGVHWPEEGPDPFMGRTVRQKITADGKPEIHDDGRPKYVGHNQVVYSFYRDTGISVAIFNKEWLLDGKDIKQVK